MRTFDIFTKPTCKYCTASKNLIRQHGYQIREYDIEAAPALRQVLKEAGYKTVPVIFDLGAYVGGYEELVDYLASLEGISIDQAPH